MFERDIKIYTSETNEFSKLSISIVLSNNQSKIIPCYRKKVTSFLLGLFSMRIYCCLKKFRTCTCQITMNNDIAHANCYPENFSYPPYNPYKELQYMWYFQNYYALPAKQPCINPNRRISESWCSPSAWSYPILSTNLSKAYTADPFRIWGRDRTEH
jgi:hypothetical protein